MSKVLVEESNLTAIASAIRQKLGVQTAYKPSQMATAIGTIHGEPVLETLTANANGSYSPSEGKDGFSAVTVNVPGSTLVSKSITANGSYNPSSDSADGYSSVTVNVPNSYAAGDEGKVVSSGALVSQTARSSTITENGTYDTTTNNSVTVNISGGGSSEPSLPSAYQEVEWIGFNGNQYVLVEDLPEDFLLQLLALNTVSMSESAVVGYRETSSNNMDYEIRFQNGSLNLWVRSTTYGREVLAANPTGSGVNVVREIMVQLFSQTRKKFFIGKYFTASMDLTFKGRVYAIKLFSYSRTNGVLTDIKPVRRFVPCYRKSGGEIGIYELYTGTFYTNEGTEAFTKGNDVI